MGRNASRAFNTSCGAAALAKTNACQQAAHQALSAATNWSRGSPDMPASTVKKIATPNELRGPGGRQLREIEEGAERAGSLASGARPPAYSHVDS